MASHRVLQVLLVGVLIGLQMCDEVTTKSGSTATITDAPTTTSGSAPSGEPTKVAAGLKEWELAAIIVSAIIVAAICVAVVFYVVKKPKVLAVQPPSDEEKDAEGAEAEGEGEGEKAEEEKVPSDPQ